MPGLGDLGGLADQLRAQEEAARRQQLSTQPRAGRGAEAAQASVERMRRRRSSATPKPTPEVKPGFNLEAIRDSFTPWEQRSGTGNYWEGMTERQALDKADDVFRRFREGDIGVDGVMVELNFTPEEARSFTEYKGGRGGTSKIRDFGVPHTAGQENMWTTLMNESGNQTRSLSSMLGDPNVTDLLSNVNGNGALVDVQNIYTNPGLSDRITLDFVNNLRNNNDGLGLYMFNEADNNDSIRNIIQKVTRTAGQRPNGRGANYGLGKVLQSRNFEGLNVGLPDYNIGRFNRRQSFAKDALIGGIYDKSQITNLTGRANHGTYNPMLPDRGTYALNLNEMRPPMLDMTKGDLLSLDGRPLRDSGKLAITAPLDEIQKISGGKDFFKTLVSSPVMQAARRIAANPGFRAAGVALAGIPVLGSGVDAATGTYDVITKKGDEQVRGAGYSVSGLTGLAAAAAPVTAPVLGPISAGLGLGNMAADMAKERRENNPALTINSDKAENAGAFIHTEANPVTIQAPISTASVATRIERARAKNKRRGTAFN